MAIPFKIVWGKGVWMLEAETRTRGINTTSNVVAFHFVTFHNKMGFMTRGTPPSY